MHGTTLRLPPLRLGAVITGLTIALLAALRFCHAGLLWADEDYHLAAALNLLHGKLPYADFWYDKPPITALYYLLIGGHAGWSLRLLDTLYVLLACLLVYRLARAWWGRLEGQVAALLLAFFLTFYLPSAVIAFAADALMLAPHLAAMYCAFARHPWLAGFFCAIAFLTNAKALFVLAACALWLAPAQWIPLIIGFAAPLAVAGAIAIELGIWHGYVEQVWRWGWIYAAGSPVTHPLNVGLTRTVNWLAFHAALVGGALFAFPRLSRGDRWKLSTWLLLSFAAVCLGTRFAPHYFLQLLPVLVIAGARGLVLAWRRYRVACAVLVALALAVPFFRFGPRYALLAYDALENRPTHWNDIAMDVDAKAAASTILSAAHPADTLFVWGYRPDIYVYTRLTSDSRFWDSQPLTGVPADRHLEAREPIYSGPAARNRLEFMLSRPNWLVDGLGPLNPQLAPAAFPELQPWLAHYRLYSQTGLSRIYRRID